MEVERIKIKVGEDTMEFTRSEIDGIKAQNEDLVDAAKELIEKYSMEEDDLERIVVNLFMQRKLGYGLNPDGTV